MTAKKSNTSAIFTFATIEPLPIDTKLVVLSFLQSIESDLPRDMYGIFKGDQGRTIYNIFGQHVHVKDYSIRHPRFLLKGADTVVINISADCRPKVCKRNYEDVMLLKTGGLKGLDVPQNFIFNIEVAENTIFPDVKLLNLPNIQCNFKKSNKLDTQTTNKFVSYLLTLDETALKKIRINFTLDINYLGPKAFANTIKLLNNRNVIKLFAVLVDGSTNIPTLEDWHQIATCADNIQIDNCTYNAVRDVKNFMDQRFDKCKSLAISLAGFDDELLQKFGLLLNKFPNLKSLRLVVKPSYGNSDGPMAASNYFYQILEHYMYNKQSPVPEVKLSGFNIHAPKFLEFCKQKCGSDQFQSNLKLHLSDMKMAFGKKHNEHVYPQTSGWKSNPTLKEMIKQVNEDMDTLHKQLLSQRKPGIK